MSKITLTDENGTYTIECICGPSIDDIVGNLVIPILRAAGYSQTSIDSIFKEV